MAKRKVEESDEESAEYSESESSDSQPKAKGKQTAKRSVGPLDKKKSQIKKKESSDEEEELEAESFEEEKPIAKKPRREDKEPSGSIKVLKSKEGDKYIDLGKMKHATVRAFKGIPLLDIREFYSAGGEEKPGKKGISLTLEQWKSLKDATSTIDKLFEGLKK